MSKCRDGHQSEYRLDDEKRARIRDCLAKACIALQQRSFEQLTRGIEVSIDQFCRVAPEGTFRESHDALRELWQLSHDDDPPVAVLRARIQALPSQAIEYVDRRASIVIARLFPTEAPVTRFLEWAGTADRAKLVAATRVLSADGGRGVEGRSRGRGIRSSPRLEPVIMGEVRGAGARHHRGGRPRNAKHRDLVMNLAMDWISATGEAPKPGRSDYTSFGELVHSIFQWLDLPDGSAAHALRRYWAEVATAQADEERLRQAFIRTQPPRVQDWLRCERGSRYFTDAEFQRAVSTTAEYGQNILGLASDSQEFVDYIEQQVGLLQPAHTETGRQRAGMRREPDDRSAAPCADGPVPGGETGAGTVSSAGRRKRGRH